MNKLAEIKNNLQKGIITLFIISVIATSIGYILEIFTFSKNTDISLYNNLVSLTITLFATSLFIYKKKNLKISYLIIIYTIIANIIFGTYFNTFDELRLNIFLRDSLFVMLYLTLAALAIHKRHAIIISVLYLLSIIGITIITGNLFLKNSIPLIVMGVGTYGIVISYFVGLLNKTINELEKNNTTIELQANQMEDQNDELVKINKTKDKFLSILAHDLKNPLITILGFAELINKKFDEISDDSKKRYISNIHITTKKTYDLLINILEWARSQMGVIKYNPEKIELDLLLRTNLDLYSEIGKNKSIAIKNSLQKNSLVFADKNMLDTVIRNLLSNAIKFTNEGGEINTNCFKKNNDIIVEISDNGIGMGKDELEKMFKIDQTISRSGTSDETGSGLGLLLCKDFTTKCNGQIWVSSKPGKGSTFSFSIPILIEEDNALYSE